MDPALAEELPYGTRRASRHKLDEFTSGQFSCRFAFAVICDKSSLGDVDSTVFYIVSTNVEQDNLGRFLMSNLISEKE
jgi:ribulose-5-phosphate 4-epimerase/fuculose-1-phosphate aldolase